MGGKFAGVKRRERGNVAGGLPYQEKKRGRRPWWKGERTEEGRDFTLRRCQKGREESAKLGRGRGGKKNRPLERGEKEEYREIDRRVAKKRDRRKMEARGGGKNLAIPVARMAKGKAREAIHRKTAEVRPLL